MSEVATTKYPKETADVHKRFSIPKGESVVTHFACAHKGKVLKQGRLYITQNHLCFYANLLGKTHKKLIDYTDIADIAKANYGVFPNAIKITTLKNKEVVFASFLLREQAYDAIRHEWLNTKSRSAVYRVDADDGADGDAKKEDDKHPEPAEQQAKKKKKRFSLDKIKSHEKKRSVDTEMSDLDLGSDVSSNGRSKKRNSVSSTTSNESRHSGKHSAPNSAPNSAPSTPSTPSRTPSMSPSAPSTPVTSAPSTPKHESTRADRAQALIESGAIVTTEEPATPANTGSRPQSQQGMLAQSATEQPAPPPTPAPVEKPIWQRIFFCCY